jgi:tetratricopeptide (TPR) repeat protein
MLTMSARLDTLRQMIERDPASSFVRYGLAMELLNLGRAEEAIEQFRTLLEADPDYCAAYYHGGRALESQGRVGEARDLYRIGVAAAVRTGDEHTRGELEAALEQLP